MQISQPRAKIQFGEIISNLFHGAVALGFGLMTLAAALHVVSGLA